MTRVAISMLHFLKSEGSIVISAGHLLFLSLSLLPFPILLYSVSRLLLLLLLLLLRANSDTECLSQ